MVLFHHIDHSPSLAHRNVAMDAEQWDCVGLGGADLDLCNSALPIPEQEHTRTALGTTTRGTQRNAINKAGRDGTGNCKPRQNER